jgi:hypothetical protein
MVSGIIRTVLFELITRLDFFSSFIQLGIENQGYSYYKIVD